MEQLPFAITSERMEYAEACIPIYQTCYPEILAELEGLQRASAVMCICCRRYCSGTYAMPPSCNCFLFCSDRP